jgi:hypothetical protein
MKPVKPESYVFPYFLATRFQGGQAPARHPRLTRLSSGRSARLVRSGCEAVPSAEADEPGQCEHLLAFQPGGCALEKDDLLLPARSDGLYEAPAALELFDERRGNFGKRRGHDDGVVRGAVRNTAAPVPDQQVDIADAMPGKIPLCLLNEIGPHVDAHDIVGQASQQRGLEADTGADFEHVLVPGKAKALDHSCRERRLRGHLPVPDRDRNVVIGDCGIVGRDESCSR